MLVDMLEDSVVVVNAIENVFVLADVLEDAAVVVGAFEDCRVR